MKLANLAVVDVPHVGRRYAVECAVCDSVNYFDDVAEAIVPVACWRCGHDIHTPRPQPQEPQDQNREHR